MKKIKLVKNWRDCWKWFSTWAFAMIVFLASTPLPPEVMALLPESIQHNLIAIVAVCGLLLRFINQSKTSSPAVHSINPHHDG
ncbi:hypothetical protein [Acinetobacter sp. c3-l95]|uniref:DUF7940 domain-containing protein n=1 Tax=Acinetobacter sp. c3-l95 TaxID=3342804 RepID=UPI0035B9B6E9